jgi:hypothetical protein
MMNKLLLAASLAAACMSTAHAGVIDKAQREQAAQSQTWSAWGGQIGVRWNRDLLDNLGVTLGAAPTAQLQKTDFRRHEWFDVRQSAGVQFTVINGTLNKFTGGSLQMRGGYVLALRDGTRIDMRDLSLRVRPGDANILDIVSGDGKVWFYSDRIMFRLGDDKNTLEVKAADVRISKALADRLGVPESESWEIADIAMDTQIFVQGADPQPDRVCTPYPWPDVAVPGVAGATYQADLFMADFNIDPVGCQSCDGPGGANDGIAGFAPSSTLRNNINDGTIQNTIANDPLGRSTALYTGNIAWQQMFSGPQAPYGNDQHPFLIWNMYRINANGSIEQIGRSGVKHAFLTINANCADSCNEFDSLGRGCGDTYGTGNNDSPGDMGPRSEIVPATGTWGRCGSIWDSACTGNQHDNGNDSWTQRLKTHESQIDPAANTGASYMFESWYVAREDINIYNSMATITGVPHYSGGGWSFNGQSNFKLGPAIDRWVNPTAPPANSMNTELAATEGHAKVAVKVTSLGAGKWRYDYAVQNLDFARAVTQAPDHGPDPRVLSNKGFDSFSVPVANAQIVSAGARVGDVNPNLNWRTQVAGGRVNWSNDLSVTSIGSNRYPMPTSLATLDWGVLYSFSFIANSGPVSGNATLHVAQSGSPASYDVATLVPSGSSLRASD